MPNTASAKKRMRQDAVRRTRNRSTKSTLRTQLRKVRAAIAAKKLDESETEFRTLVKKLDKAAGAQRDPRQRGRPHEVAHLARDQGTQRLSSAAFAPERSLVHHSIFCGVEDRALRRTCASSPSRRRAGGLSSRN